MELLKVAKIALYGMFLNYYCYYIIQGSFIPHGTLVFFCVTVVCTGMTFFQERYVYIGKEIRSWFLYGAFAWMTTLLTTSPFEGVTADAIKYMQRLAIIAIIAYICERENSIKFGLRLLAVNAIGCAGAVLYTVDDIQQKLSLATTASVSANDVGALMAFGCFAVLFAFGTRRRTSIVATAFKAAAIIAMVTVIFLAGSRKSFLAILIMAVLLILLCGHDYLQRSSLLSTFVLIIIGLVAFQFISANLAPHMEETNLYVRMFGRGVEGAASSDDVRLELYIWALKDFANHPLVGIGFNKFVEAHGNYTHSTYAEPLACSGLIGLLYLVPYFNILRNQIRLIQLNAYDNEGQLVQKEILAFLIMFLFVGVGIPYMYKDNPCIILGTIIASQHISFGKLQRK